MKTQSNCDMSSVPMHLPVFAVNGRLCNEIVGGDAIQPSPYILFRFSEIQGKEMIFVPNKLRFKN